MNFIEKLALHKIKLEDETLERVLTGYDYLTIKPNATPAKFID